MADSNPARFRVWKVDWAGGSNVQFTNYSYPEAIIVVNDWVLATLLREISEVSSDQVYGSLLYYREDPAKYCIRLIINNESSTIAAFYATDVFDLLLINFPELVPEERGEVNLPN